MASGREERLCELGFILPALAAEREDSFSNVPVRSLTMHLTKFKQLRYSCAVLGASLPRCTIFFCFLILPFSLARAQTQASAPAAAPSQALEQRAARAFEKARANPLELRSFLARMPKGGDLHNHLDGAVYAESYIRAGAEEHLCVVLPRNVLYQGSSL